MPRFLGAGKGLRETRSWPTGCRRNPNTAGEIMTKDGVSVLVGAACAMSRSSCSTFCRCLNIPARYVNGHLGDIGVPVVDPMDFSAWIVPWGPAPRSLHGQRAE